MSQSTPNTNIFSQNFDDLLASVGVTPENQSTESNTSAVETPVVETPVVETPENHTNDYRVDTDIFGESPFKDTVEPEAKPEVKPEAKPEVKPEAKPEAKPEVKPEAKPEAKPEVKPEAKPEAKTKQKRAPRKTKAHAPVTNGKLTVEVEINDKVLTLLGEERIQDIQTAAQEFINKAIKENAQKAFDDLW